MRPMPRLTQLSMEFTFSSSVKAVPIPETQMEIEFLTRIITLLVSPEERKWLRTISQTQSKLHR